MLSGLVRPIARSCSSSDKVLNSAKLWIHFWLRTNAPPAPGSPFGIKAIFRRASSFGLAPPKYNNVDNATLKSLPKKGVKIVDIRRADEWKATGVIEGSKRITAFDHNGNFNRSFPGEFEKHVGKNEAVILICRSGNRSSVLSQMLTEQGGFSKVYNVTQGIMK